MIYQLKLSKKVQELTDGEKKEIGKYLISQEVSTLDMTSRESIVKKHLRYIKKIRLVMVKAYY